MHSTWPNHQIEIRCHNNIEATDYKTNSLWPSSGPQNLPSYGLNPCGNCLMMPYLKEGSDHVRSRLSDQQIYVTALIRFVYGPNKFPLLLIKVAWSIPYLRYPYGPDRIWIRSTLLVISIYCLLLPFVLILASVWLCHNLFKPAYIRKNNKIFLNMLLK